jgi:hypothetical protein
MQFDLNDEETRALLNLLTDAIEADCYPLSPRVGTLRAILLKFGEVGGLPPELARKMRRAVPPAPAPRPPTRTYEPPRKGKYAKRR